MGTGSRNDELPILGVSDASVLSSELDLTIIVVQHRRFPKDMIQRVKQSIENVGGTILGVVLNNVDIRHDQSYGYYTSYYNYYSPSKNVPEKSGQKAQAASPATTKPKPQSGEY
jgi:Mrp family chromosome partitioning ATPase